MTLSRGPSGGSRGGRAKGTPNRDKRELRTRAMESVAEFTRLRREEIKRDLLALNPDMSDAELLAAMDAIQPLVEDYDPVVHLAVMSVDMRHKAELRMAASANAAQYLRPKLKSIEMTRDTDQENARMDLASRVVDLLQEVALGKAKEAERPTFDKSRD